MATNEETSLGAVIDRFRGQHVEVKDRIVDLVLKSGSQETVLEGPRFHRRMLEIFYQLCAQGIAPSLIRWFHYDSDWSKNDPQDCYSFFLVYDNKIIDECLVLYDSVGDGFDPMVLVPSGISMDNWSKDEASDNAWDRFWFRKFYN